MTMKKWIALSVLLAVAACSKPVQVPTEAEFEATPKMLSDWMQKCTKGEYSNLGIEEQSKMCGSAQAASNALLQKARAKQNAKLFQ
ncbi:hypothetical protein DM450_25150 (plasmid) [Sphingomonas sp. IC081]|nr:hypothetical protein DM450_25150 [Sphingomonas sp. IC081]